MRIIMTDPDTGKRYKIEPFDNGLCWRVFRSVEHRKGTKAKGGQVVKNDWSFTEKYPSDLPAAIDTVLRLMLADPDGKVELDCKPDNVQKNVRKYIADMADKVMGTIMVESMKGDTTD